MLNQVLAPLLSLVIIGCPYGCQPGANASEPGQSDSACACCCSGCHARHTLPGSPEDQETDLPQINCLCQGAICSDEQLEAKPPTLLVAGLTAELLARPDFDCRSQTVAASEHFPPLASGRLLRALLASYLI